MKGREFLSTVLPFSMDGSLIDNIFKMITARLNTAVLYALWATAPILVSIISFSVYVMQGKELSVATAFTVWHLSMQFGLELTVS